MVTKICWYRIAALKQFCFLPGILWAQLSFHWLFEQEEKRVFIVMTGKSILTFQPPSRILDMVKKHIEKDHDEASKMMLERPSESEMVRADTSIDHPNIPSKSQSEKSFRLSKH